MNPFAGRDDPTTVAAAQQGDRDALTEIIERHRPWVYNIAVRMMGDAGSAEDATQDIFIKVLKGLARFEGRSSFRTWLYRVAFHYLLNAKRSLGEQAVGTFEEYGAGLDAAPNLGLEDIPQPERELLVEEAMTACMTGMLLCLSREQRLAYVLGSVFSVTDTVASEILGIAATTYRKRLQRARAELHNFMNGHCGLINKDNPCRCARKTRAFFEAGHLDRKELKFQRDRVASIGEVASRDAAVVYEKLTNDYPALYRKHPFSDPKQLAERLSTLLQGTALDGLLGSSD
ncbi:MAG: RNA polymerase sigma factor [Deltaproteobacteria bacterium]|nr:RNA polymerase sigma factor [Deltaproteobacteria bacterium]